jgi:hypothetical protein
LALPLLQPKEDDMPKAAKNVVQLKPLTMRQMERALDADPKVRLGRIADRLRRLAKKADLISLECFGEMELQQDESISPIADAADELHDALSELAEEVQS